MASIPVLEGERRRAERFVRQLIQDIGTDLRVTILCGPWEVSSDDQTWRLKISLTKGKQRGWLRFPEDQLRLFKKNEPIPVEIRTRVEDEMRTILTMAVIVSLHGVVTEMDVFSDEHTAYINRRTGELITVTHEELALAEDLDAAAEAPHWQQDLLPKAREVIESEDFLPLPSKFEIHEWAIMERFARSVSDPAESDELLDVLHGRRAFRRFKDALQRLELTEEWYRYRESALEEIAVEFLEANEIAYDREPKP